jgi:hypothetical protein
MVIELVPRMSLTGDTGEMLDFQLVLTCPYVAESPGLTPGL